MIRSSTIRYRVVPQDKSNKGNEYIGQAILGDELILMGEDALQPKLVIPWQRILLWTVLVRGVLILGVMAMRLFKQINVTETDEG
jgi:hypothetical protein